MKHSQKHRIVALLLLVATFLSMLPLSVGSYAAYDEDDAANEDYSENLYGGRTLAQILDLISGVNYDNYRNKWSDQTAANADVTFEAEDVVVPNSSSYLKPQSTEQWTTSDYQIFYDEARDATKKDNSTMMEAYEGYTAVYTPSTGKTTFAITVPVSGMYAIDLKYITLDQFVVDDALMEQLREQGLVTEMDTDFGAQSVLDLAGVKELADSASYLSQVSTKTTVERMFFIDDELPFSECRYLYLPRSWEYRQNDGNLSEIYRDSRDEDDPEIITATQPRRADYQSDADYEAALVAWAIATRGGSGNYYWNLDIQNNDMRPERVEEPVLRDYFLRDWLGYTVTPFEFYLEAGETYHFTFEATREPVAIDKIRVYGYGEENSYDYVLERWLNNGIKEVSKGDAEEKFYMVEAESPIRVSDQVLFPGTDRTSSINSPSHPANLVYNLTTMSMVNQYMTYNVYVEEEGLYNVMTRFRQNTMAGMFVSRRMKINGEVQFREANYLRFNYDTSFQNEILGNMETGQDYLFYFKKGWNTIEIEVVLGDMADYIYDISNIINKLNNAYQKILQITGTNPDTGRDYDFAGIIPDVIQDLAISAVELDRIYNELVEITGATGQHVATLDTIRDLVEKMAKDEYEIAPNFLSFKNYVTALSNWLYTSLSQPMKLDYLRIQTTDTEMPDADAGFFYAMGHEAKAFVSSFFKDYNVIGFKVSGDAGHEYAYTIEMWNTESREDALIKRTMIDSSFTDKDDPKRNIAVNIKYVAMGLQESVLAGIGPDVSNMAAGTAVSWGIRNSVEELSRIYTEKDIENQKNIREGAAVGEYMFEGFRDLCPIYTETRYVEYENSVGKWVVEEQLAGEFMIPHYYYNEETKKVEFKNAQGWLMNKKVDEQGNVTYEYALDENGEKIWTGGDIDVQFSHAGLESVSLNKKTYLIPTNMNYEMSFYRVDIFAKEGIEPPRTWQELLEVIPKLTTSHMTMGMQTSLPGYQMLLYQMGETMYANDYTEFNKSAVALEAFDTLCNLFNDYSLPISYDLTRFRTGEIPIVVANWSTYNTFMSYYELRGLWTMESLIGWERVDANGTKYVDRSSILDVSGIIIPRGSGSPTHVWEYIKWYTDDDAQNELCRLNLADQNNTTVKYNTANLNALLSQAWTDEERESMKEQIPHLKGLPFNPGDYNISRYINFAFLAVYNKTGNAVDQFLDHVVDINKELSRKRKEYFLPYLEDGEIIVPEDTRGYN